MRAVIVEAPGQVGVRDVPDPMPAPGQVVLEVQRCGLCGTDRHTVSGANPFARFPVILGHEFAGHVVALGSDVTRLELGTLVAVDPSYFCGACPQCRDGYPNLCPFKGGYGSAKNGGLARFAAVEAASCEPVPDGVDAATAALAEPLACVLHGMDNLGPVLGENVLVYGGGPIGLISCSMLARAGAASVTLVEPAPGRRQAGLGLGAHQAVGSGTELPDGPIYHAVIDASGNESAMNDAVTRIRSGGRFLILGVADQKARLHVSPFDLNWRELRIIGSMAVRHSFNRAVAVLGTGMIDGKRLISDCFGLEEITDALAGLGDAGQLKVQIDPSRPSLS